AVIRPKTSIAMRNESNLFIDCTSGSAYGLACPKSKQKLLSFGVPINFVSTSRVDYCANANLTALSRRVPKAKEMWRRKGQEVEALESTAVTEERDSRFNGSRFTILFRPLSSPLQYGDRGRGEAPGNGLAGQCSARSNFNGMLHVRYFPGFQRHAFRARIALASSTSYPVDLSIE